MKQDIRFVDLETGNTFDGTSHKDTPYIFWLDGEQSVNIIYSQPICFISNQKKIMVGIEESEVFALIDPSKLLNSELETIYGFEYHNINHLKSTSVESIGTEHHNYYVHMIYIIASAKQAGEYICEFTIDGTVYNVGGDFYGEDEALYVNLSNGGVEIPEVVQKAIYGVNLHEEKRDNITLNRKWKELLSNMWDVVANKGSYKSLFNSLQWFEYGDNVKMHEVWKNLDTNHYFSQEVKQLLSDRFQKTLNGFVKTTYFSLYYALEKNKVEDGKVVLDEEKNPVLEAVVSKWSVQDLALKLCMLGNFYETYFTPIHVDLLHATIEDIVYTNTFKVIQGNTVDRSDFVYNFEDIKCNVKDGDVFRLNKVESFVGPETLFGLTYEELQREGVMIGVQPKPVSKLESNLEWQQFASQLYNEIGAVVDFELEIPLTEGDKIKREILIFKTFANNEWSYKTKIDYRVLGNKINFSLFCPAEGDYDIRLQFDSLNGKVFTKRIKFDVIDTENIAINVYKIYNMQMLDDEELGQSSIINDYIFTRRNVLSLGDIDYKRPIQYIPAKCDNLNTSKFNWKGICLNQLLIFKHNLLDGSVLTPSELKIWQKYYFTRIRQVGEGAEYKEYTICVSKIFGFNSTQNINIKLLYEKLVDQMGLLYREDYIFVPEFHKLVEIDNERHGRMENLEYYKITDNDALCVVPELAYGKCIAEYDWEFVNASRPFEEPVKLAYVKEPFITGDGSPLTPGYYNIRFNYRLTNEKKINTIELNSAFKKV
jgi:hypothetical protein